MKTEMFSCMILPYIFLIKFAPKRGKPIPQNGTISTSDFVYSEKYFFYFNKKMLFYRRMEHMVAYFCLP